MKDIYDLWLHRKEPKGRINLTMFLVNTFLIICHLFFLVVFIILKSKFMFIYNLISLVMYLLMVHICYKKSNIYVGVAFLEVLLYMLLCIFNFGWNGGFQLWSYAVITACFLPAYNAANIKTTRKMSISYTIIVSAFYIALFLLRNSITPKVALSSGYTNLLYLFNSTMTILSIVLFTVFYSSKSQRREFELSRKADYDELTGLYNRYIITQIHTRIKEEAKKNNASYSIAILDIDHFKKVNDKYGHNSGDLILKEVSGMLKTISSKNIACGRWGGEEFILIGSDSMSYKEFMNILYKFNAKVYKTKFKIESGKEINLTVSIGAANVSSDLTIEEAVGAADTNLYEAKNTGRNKVMG